MLMLFVAFLSLSLVKYFLFFDALVEESKKLNEVEIEAEGL